jgi:hypothetical protein
LRVQWTPPDRSHTAHSTQQHSTANNKQEHENLKRKDTIFFVFSFLARISVFLSSLFFVFRPLWLLSQRVWGCVRVRTANMHVRTVLHRSTYVQGVRTNVLSQQMNLHPSYSSFEVSCLAPLASGKCIHGCMVFATLACCVLSLIFYLSLCCLKSQQLAAVFRQAVS